MVGQTRAYKNTGRNFLRWSRNQVNRIIRYLLCVFLCEKISSELARQGDELLSALISSELGCHISRDKNAGQSEPRRLPVERIVRSNPPEIRRENCVAFSSAFSHQRDGEDDPRFIRNFPSRAWNYRRNFRECIYIRWLYFLPREKIRNNHTRQKGGNGHATWKALIIYPCFAYLRDVAKAWRFSSRRPESRNFFRETWAKLSLSLSISRWNNAILVWILYGAKMHFPRRFI